LEPVTCRDFRFFRRRDREAVSIAIAHGRLDAVLFDHDAAFVGTDDGAEIAFREATVGRGFVGKAMVVSIDKATALKMHDKVRKHWAAERERVRREMARLGYLVSGRKQACFGLRL